MKKTPQGFVLLIAVILTSVTLTIGLAILDVAYKQVILATTAKQSQYAFYNAESVMECALYYDQKFNSFAYGAAVAPPGASILCNGVAIANYSRTIANPQMVTFDKPCASGSATVSGTVSIYKTPLGATTIYASGFNTCNPSDPQRIERGLKALY